jgi:hypothetical protein
MDWSLASSVCKIPTALQPSYPAADWLMRGLPTSSQRNTVDAAIAALGLTVETQQATRDRIASLERALCRKRKSKTAAQVPAWRIGDRTYDVGGAVIVLTDGEDTVLLALIELGGTADKEQLIKRSGILKAPVVLLRIVKKYADLAPYIDANPGAKGRGGYQTRIRSAACR